MRGHAGVRLRLIALTAPVADLVLGQSTGRQTEGTTAETGRIDLGTGVIGEMGDSHGTEGMTVETGIGHVTRVIVIAVDLGTIQAVGIVGQTAMTSAKSHVIVTPLGRAVVRLRAADKAVETEIPLQNKTKSLVQKTGKSSCE